MKELTPAEQRERFARDYEAQASCRGRHGQHVLGRPGVLTTTAEPPKPAPTPPNPDTIVSYVLTAARALDRPFTLEKLAVTCWRMFPGSFHLRGYSEYPDPTPIRNCVFGKRGLIARGFLAPAGKGLYVVTEAP